MKRAILKTKVKTCVIAGGVAANKYIRKEFKMLENDCYGISWRVRTGVNNTNELLCVSYASLGVKPGVFWCKFYEFCHVFLLFSTPIFGPLGTCCFFFY